MPPSQRLQRLQRLQREVHQADAVSWLQKLRQQGGAPGHSLVASLPDSTEFPDLSLEEWKVWFTETAALVLACAPPEGVTIFYQRDAKHEGRSVSGESGYQWIDKSFLIQKAAERENVPLLWHKIVCRATPGAATFGKPAYSHLLCFSKGVRIPLSKSTPDVIVKAGKGTWARGMGREVCELVCRFVLERTATRILLNPFCGEGLLLEVANELGLSAVGIEKSRKRAERARAGSQA